MDVMYLLYKKCSVTVRSPLHNGIYRYGELLCVIKIKNSIRLIIWTYKMMNPMTNEILDNAILLNRLLWILDDVSFNKLLSISQTHLRLAKEHAYSSSPERRKAIIAEIEALRAERNLLLEVRP